MTITLDERERAALVRLIESSLAELRFEAARIDRQRDAIPLWDDEHVLMALLDRLRAEDRPAV